MLLAFPRCPSFLSSASRASLGAAGELQRAGLSSRAPWALLWGEAAKMLEVWGYPHRWG